MGGSSKSGNSNAGKSYDYFGTIGGAVCVGPVEGLSAVIVDGAEVWPRADVWEDGETIALNDLRAYGGKTYKALSGHTASTVNAPPDSSHWDEYFLDAGSDDYSDLTIDALGDLRIYWGTQTQVVDSFLNGNEFGESHPDYVGICYVVLIDFLFGREKVSAPNVEVVVRKRPNQIVIAGNPASLQDGQANMMAVAAELFTSDNALGLSTAALDPLSFQDAADALDDTPTLTAASPLFDQQDTVASFLDGLSAIADGFVRFNPTSGLIEAGVFTHGTAPASYTLLTVDDLTERPQFDAEGWSQAKTRAVVSFTDRERSYKQSSDKYDDLRAFRVLQEHRPLSLQRPHITRRAQAIAHGGESLRTAGRPQTTGTLVVRREKGRNIRPGDYIRFDIDIEPGGSGLLQYFRVMEREVPFTGPIRFSVQADVTLSPIPYTPGDNPQPLTPATVDAIAHQRVFEASLTLAGGANTLMVLAERPTSLITGFHLYYDQLTAGTFQRIGTATGFATRATLRTNLTSGAGTIEITVPDQVDLDRLSVQPGDIPANDDNLLAVLLKINSGQVDEDASGYAIAEICSISAQAIVSGSNYNLTVLRGRQGTTAKAFTTATAEVWIIPRASLIGFIHADFATLRANKVAATTPDTAYFRLTPFTYVSARDLGDCSSVSFKMPTKAQSAPSLALTLPATNPLSVSAPYPSSLTISGTWTDLDADLTSYQILLQNPAGTEVLLEEEVFTQTDTKAFSVISTIDTTGTWILTLKAFDAAGLITTRVVTITAGAGTAKPAKPTIFHDGTAIPTATNPALAPSAYGITGKLLATSATFGATISYRYRMYNVGAGYQSAFTSWSGTPPQVSGYWILSQQPTYVLDNGERMLIEAKATRSGVDSDSASCVLIYPANI